MSHACLLITLQGCAYGLGFCASSHLDIALAKLESVAKMDMARKSTGFFGLVKVGIGLGGDCPAPTAFLKSLRAVRGSSKPFLLSKLKKVCTLLQDMNNR